MQLKLKRSQRDGGIISTTAIFCLDARVEFTPEEKASIVRYKLHKQVIYNSEAQKQLLAKSEAHAATGTFTGNLKSLAAAAFALTKLYITISSLERGQYVECKSLDELLGAEEAVLQACENLKGYLDVAQTFDGTEVVVDFHTGKPEVVATSPPTPQLAAMPPPPHPALMAPAADEPAELEYAEYETAPVEGDAGELDVDFWDTQQFKIGASVAILVLIVIFVMWIP